MRAAFDAHGIPVVINAEHHASLFGALGGAFVPLHIYVDEQDFEEAAALLHDLRGAVLAEGDVVAEEGELQHHDEEASEPDDHDEEAGASSVRARIYTRRHTAIVVLLAFCVTFGTAHMSMRAWLRGFTLAGLQVLGIKWLIVDPGIGGAIIIGCLVCDLVGALLLLRARSSAARNAGSQHQRCVVREATATMLTI